MYGGGTANQGQVAERGPQPGQVVGTPLRVHLRKQPLWHGHHAASTKFYKRGDYIPDLLVAPLLPILLQYQERAQTMQPPRRESRQLPPVPEHDLLDTRELRGPRQLPGDAEEDEDCSRLDTGSAGGSDAKWHTMSL